MTNNNVLSLYKYNTWANATLMEHLKQLPEGTERITIKSVFPSLFQALMHIYIIDRGWYAALTKAYRPDDYEAVKRSVESLISETNDNTLDELRIKQQLLANDFGNFIVSNDMSYTELFSGVRMSYGDIILHLVNHGTYHRGNITAMLHQLDYKGVPTDYGFYLYQQATHT